MDDIERIGKIRAEAENLIKKGFTSEYLIHELYTADKVLSQATEKNVREPYELARDAFIEAIKKLEVLKKVKIGDPRTTRVYRGWEQLHGVVHQADKPPEGKRRPSQGRRRK